MVPLKYLSNFWGTLEMSLTNCEINIYLNQCKNYVIVATDVNNQGKIFSITDTKLYVPLVTLSTQDHAKLLEQLKSGFKRTVNWNKYQSKKSTERPNQYLDYLIEASFQEVNRPFVLSFENNTHRTSYKRYFLLTVEINYCNVMIEGKNFFDQLVKSNLRTYDSIGKILAGQRDDYTTGCLLDNFYFKDYYKMIVTDLSKQQAFDADPKAIQQINFTGNLGWDPVANTTMFFIIEEAKETVLDILQGPVKVI